MSHPSFAVEEATIASIHKAFLDGSLTCRALVEAYLRRIDAYDRNGPALNSIVTVNPGVLAEADRLDAQLAETKALVGPLHGIPVLVKDQVETAGIMTTFGSIAMDGYVPKQDAPAITKVKAAGGLILGKTTMPDFAVSWFGFSSKSGETKNPYALDRDCGGSSAGTAASIAANLGAIGIGEDTGGSIRLPASFCNLVGVRVTPGLISRTGMSPLVVFQDTAGPVTRTVTDAAILLDALVGYDPQDPYTIAYTIAGHKGSYTDHLDADGLKGARVGVLKEAFGTGPDNAEVNAVVQGAIETMRQAGVTVVEVSLPDVMEHVIETSLYILHSRHDLNKFLAARPELPYHSLDEIHAAGKYHKVLDLLEAVMTGPKHPHDDPEYFRKYAGRELFQRAVVDLLARNDLLAICYPAVQVVPPTKADVRDGKTETLTFPTNTLIASQTWMPSICMPAGFTPGGIPVGMEFVVAPYHEQDLFRIGYAFEQLTHNRRAPESAPAL
jgi:amidase